MTNLRVAVDVGGTFTDICILDEDGGEIQVGKVPSTADPIEAVVSGVVDAGIDVRDIVLFSHGTTVATNALITRNLPPAAMVTTRHFRDVIEIRRGTKSDLWDAYNDVAPPYIRRRDRFEVTERIDHAYLATSRLFRPSCFGPLGCVRALQRALVSGRCCGTGCLLPDHGHSNQLSQRGHGRPE